MKSKIYNILLTLVIALAAVACAEDPLYDPSYIGEGEAEVTAEVTFTPLYPSLSRSVTGGTPGDAIKEIENLCIVFYNEKNEYVNHFYYDEPLTTESKERPDDYNDTNRAETTTRKATVKIPKLSYGKYHVYAVANVDKGLLTDEIVKNIETLKKFELVWNEEKVAANNQMFGYFSANNASTGFEAPEIVINQKSVKLHAWIKRAASKVTVAFDGRNLKEGVKIFIKSVAIKDIPKYCYLGADSPAEAEKEIELIKNGQVMIYGSGDSYTEDWIGYISKDHPINGYNQDIVNSNDDADTKLKALHSETTNAFYLFENKQGMGVEGTPSDKYQQVNQKHKDDHIVSYPDGVDPTNIAWKDAKKYGSYIEVKAHYDSNDPVEQSGEITYRFMLGMDTHLDYNVERNHHYQLTLKFNGWANDVDWHIDYRKGPDNVLRFPHPFYISYLYGQTTMIPIEFEVDEARTIKKVEATIKSNGWGPAEVKDETIGYSGSDQPNANGEYYFYVSSSNVNNPEAFPWNGFLSLTKPKNLLALTGTPPWTVESNKAHYLSEKADLSHRVYEGDDVKISTIPLYDAMANNKLFVERVDRTYFVKLPIWTRARQLIAETAYTGNNPYNSYYRHAIVHVEVTLDDGTVLKSDVDEMGQITDESKKDVLIKQVRRLINPKGIWRSNTNPKPFHVVLKVLESENSENFINLTSDGAWRAYVIRDTQADNATGEGGFVSLKGAAGTTTATTTFEFNKEIMTRKSIEGTDQSEIDFTVNFSGPNTSGKPRYAIIRVEYNYCSCYHLIFVRQGYEADDTFGDGRKWCTVNCVNQNTLADNPLDEGSLFRFNNWNGIKSESNVNNKSPWTRITPNDFIGNAGTNLSTTSVDGNKDNIKWSDLTSDNPYTTEFTPPTNKLPNNKKLRIATYEDYIKLVPNTEDEDKIESFPIKNGYGVLYGDEAKETANTIEEAYGYKVYNKDQQAYGMRGCFVYDIRTGKNLFFPIGSSGYGHRKSYTGGYSGVLRYSSSARWGYFDAKTADYTNGLYSAPLFLDVFRSFGAIYWFNKSKVDDVTTNPSVYNKPCWDINYSTFDFKAIYNSNVWSSTYFSDACFVRCIETD
ncbi:hypothetical protein [uncultured Duncaniella sp.]|uniref:DUF4906 domain-containing protein n=1 Tax=uncultured Duncaniella sp. TaxID=2768039 RepID=UPI00263718D6|nr:hypothetical protein [uncultured Duncaniella sp.]